MIQQEKEFKINCRTCYDTGTVEKFTYTGEPKGDFLHTGKTFVTYDNYAKAVFMSFGYDYKADPDIKFKCFQNESFKDSYNAYSSVAMQCPTCSGGRLYSEIIEELEEKPKLRRAS